MDYVCSPPYPIVEANLSHSYHILSPDRAKSISTEDTCAITNAPIYTVQMVEYWQCVEQVSQWRRKNPDGLLAPLMLVLQERMMG
ncbi:hypothetical protein EYZ11_009432 [Aspergillus tanneri]|nr:hypothetical protein EYZ11_009432 [Aspergillus tanneri]